MSSFRRDSSPATVIVASCIDQSSRFTFTFSLSFLPFSWTFFINSFLLSKCDGDEASSVLHKCNGDNNVMSNENVQFQLARVKSHPFGYNEMIQHTTHTQWHMNASYVIEFSCAWNVSLVFFHKVLHFLPKRYVSQIDGEIFLLHQFLAYYVYDSLSDGKPGEEKQAELFSIDFTREREREREESFRFSEIWGQKNTFKRIQWCMSRATLPGTPVNRRQVESKA